VANCYNDNAERFLAIEQKAISVRELPNINLITLNQAASRKGLILLACSCRTLRQV
jgi:hypothetical protein